MKLNEIYEEIDLDFINVNKVSILKNGTVILHYKNKIHSYLHFKEIPSKYIKLKKLLDVRRCEKHEHDIRIRKILLPNISKKK